MAELEAEQHALQRHLQDVGSLQNNLASAEDETKLLHSQGTAATEAQEEGLELETQALHSRSASVLPILGGATSCHCHIASSSQKLRSQPFRLFSSTKFVSLSAGQACRICQKAEYIHRGQNLNFSRICWSSAQARRSCEALDDQQCSIAGAAALLLALILMQLGKRRGQAGDTAEAGEQQRLQHANRVQVPSNYQRQHVAMFVEARRIS